MVKTFFRRFFAKDLFVVILIAQQYYFVETYIYSDIRLQLFENAEKLRQRFFLTTVFVNVRFSFKGLSRYCAILFTV